MYRLLIQYLGRCMTTRLDRFKLEAHGRLLRNASFTRASDLHERRSEDGSVQDQRPAGICTGKRETAQEISLTLIQST
jgi:hypothetical protein